jgi:hypothetical protein
MPAKSESQKRLMCLAKGIKMGSVSASKFPEAAKVAKEMTLEQLKEYCPDAED